MNVFYVLNTFVFLLFIVLLMRLITAGIQYAANNYLLWLLVTIALLYLFPYIKSLWTSINYAVNYLWPATMTAGMLLVWKRLENRRIGGWLMLPVLLLACFTGWSNEGFSVGLSGGMFLYYCFHFRKFRGQIVAVCLVLWIATAIMCFSPGNLMRFFGKPSQETGSLFIKLSNGFDNFLHLKLLWLLVVLCIYLAVRKRFGKFMKDNDKLIHVFGFGTFFLFFANTAPYSMTLLEVLSLILIMRYLAGASLFRTNNKWQIAAGAVLTILFIVHQSLLVKDSVVLYRYQHEAVRRMKNALPGDVVEYQEPDISILSKPFFRQWNVSLKRELNYYWKTAQGVYDQHNKFKIVSPREKEAVLEPQKYFVPENKFPGDAPVYYSANSRYMWIDRTRLAPSDTLVGEYERVDFSYDVELPLKVKFALMPDAYPEREVLEIDTFRTRYGEALYITPPQVLRLKAINVRRGGKL